jgi:peptidoglycan/xylan/chitin deacetylase (PgdA/CDA1 family)
LFVPRSLFAQHLDVIERQRYELLTVGALWQRMRDGSDGTGCAAITFDDGLTRTAEEAIPLLLERGVSCSMFVPTAWIGRTHPDMDGEPILGASEIRELADAGVEIGAHGVDHVSLTSRGFESALDQLRRSRETLEDLIGKPVRTMAYPYGAHSAQTERAAAQAGYEVACGCAGPTPWRSLSLPREPIFASASALRLRLKMAGLYGPVHRLGEARALLRRWRE